MPAKSSIDGLPASSPSSSKKGSQHDSGLDVDRGPGLFFAGVLAFVAQVVVLCYMALNGF